MRLDKFLAHVTGYSRNDVKKFLKQKAVSVNGAIETSSSRHIDELADEISLFDDDLYYQKFVYLMLNKPTGYLSATKDGSDATVMDLLDEYYLKFDLSIAGRLDKDTEGLLLLTNDGNFLHDIISPRKKVYKKYIASITGEMTIEKMTLLEQGVEIKDGKDVSFITAPAHVKKIDEGTFEISIAEGKFHQVRRMFASVDCKVVTLKRISIGGLCLDEQLLLGEYKELSEEELDEIKKDS